jgi:hypothetical protein
MDLMEEVVKANSGRAPHSVHWVLSTFSTTCPTPAFISE